MTNFNILLKTIIASSYCIIAFLILTDFKYSIKKTLLILIPSTVILCALNFVFYRFVHFTILENFFLISFYIPECIVISFISKRNFLYELNCFLTIYLSFHLNVVCILLLDLLGVNQPIWQILVYLIILTISLFYLKLFAKRLMTFIDDKLPKMNWYYLAYTSFVLLELFLYGIAVYVAGVKRMRDYVISLGIIGLYFFSLICIYQVLKSFNKVQTELSIIKINNKHINAFKEETKIQEEHEKQLRILRHDLKHMIISVSELIRQGKTTEVLEILDSYYGKIEKTKSVRFCVDPLINTILGYYYYKCLNNNIKVDIKANHIENNLNIPSDELIILISNIFDNAINATLKLKEDRYINFIFINNNNKFVLQEENNFNGEISFDEKHLPTNFEMNHGYGTKSINTLAKHYNLNVDYDVTDKRFKIIVFM